MKVHIKGYGDVSLSKNDYVASGGEGSIYTKNSLAIKIYENPNKAIPEGKINELSSLTLTNIIKPEHVVTDKNNKVIGYTMQFIQNTVALCQLFPKPYKQRNNLDTKALLSITEQLQKGISHCHDKKVLIVDVNELNFIIDNQKYKLVYFIDVDSYQTEHFPATAIMDSVRDRHAKKWTESSDWFSFGIIAFQLFTGIHPYKGKHSSYTNIDSRMKKNVSVFNKDVSVPAIVDLDQDIPSAYRDWFYAVFEEGKRELPPLTAVPVVAVRKRIVKKVTSTALLNLELYLEYQTNIISYSKVGNIESIQTDNGLIVNNDIDNSIAPYAVSMVTKTYSSILTCIVKNSAVSVYDFKSKQFLDFNFSAWKVFSYNNRIYVAYGDIIGELIATEYQTWKTFLSVNPLCSIFKSATNIFDGVVIQDLLDSYYVSVFPNSGEHRQIKIQELSGYRIVDAKYSNKVLVVIGEKTGVFDEFTIIFSQDHSVYAVRQEKNISHYGVNFSVLDNGICAKQTHEGYLEIFSNDYKRTDVKVVQDSSIANYTLSTNGNKILVFIDNKIYTVSLK